MVADRSRGVLVPLIEARFGGDDQMSDATGASLSNDAPIRSSEQDLFDHGPFASAIANGIIGLDAPEGLVLAITGPWGSGKSSAINLIVNRIRASVGDDQLKIVAFNPWWFGGSPESLTSSFLHELAVEVGQSTNEKIRDALAGMASKFSGAGTVAASFANIFAPGSGAVISGLNAAALTKLAPETLEKQHAKVADALRMSETKFLVVIDDIDRLNPEDAVTMFRLVKSLGKLPNIIYLLAYDRQVAERIVADKFPSEGASYLDKIIQASYELPPATPSALMNALFSALGDLMGTIPAKQQTRFMNVFYDVIAPYLRSPRSVVRLANAVKISWPPIASETDASDFLAIEAIRLFEPAVFAAVRDNKSLVCGASDISGQSGTKAEEADELLQLNQFQPGDRRRLRAALMRLFPKLQSIYSNVFQTDAYEWRRQRLICSEEHFSTYFRFSLGADILPAQLVQELIKHASDPPFIKSRMHKLLQELRPGGGTKAALALEELTVAAAEVPPDAIPVLVKTLFELADELDVPEDEQKGFYAIGDNLLRLTWLLNRLVLDRVDQDQRSQLFVFAAAGAAIGWLSEFSARCKRDMTDESNEHRMIRGTVVNAEACQALQDLTLRRIRLAAKDGSLARHRHLVSLLFRWVEYEGDNKEAVSLWVDQELEKDDFVVTLTEQTLSQSWSFSAGFAGLGDRVSTAHESVRVDHLRAIFNVDRFLDRVRELAESTTASSEMRERMQMYLTIPKDGIE